MVRRIMVLLLLVAAIGGGVYYYTHRPVGELKLTGIVTTDEVSVSSQVAGRLKELKVRQGDLVKKGELLATIEADQWLADVNFYEQQEKQAATQVSVGEADRRFQEAQSAAQIAQAQASLAAATAQVTQAEADLESARLTLAHTEEAYKRGAESIQTYDQTRMNFAALKAKLESVKKQKDATEAAVNVAKSNLETVAARVATITMQKHQLDAATAQKKKAEVQLAYTEIRSPIDGIVDQRAAKQGEVVNPRDPIVTLINQDDLWVRIDVEETYISGIKMGDVLTVEFPGGMRREGTVFYRAVDADYATQRDVSRTKRDIRTFEVRLRCDNKDRRLAVGMTAYVVLPKEVMEAGRTGATMPATGVSASAPGAAEGVHENSK
jgi:HlyD family secretion protein